MENTIYTASNISEFLSAWLIQKSLSPASQKQLEDYYANFHGLCSERMHFWYRNQIREMEKLISVLDKPRVLDIGFGTGTEALWFAMLGADVTGIEIKSYQTNLAWERLKLLRTKVNRTLQCCIKTNSILDFNDNQGFDIIWMEQAFHHMEPRVKVINKIATLLRPGGYVVISESNALNPLVQLQLFRFRGFKFIVKTMINNKMMKLGNERVLSAPRLMKGLDKAGIYKKSIRYFRIFPSNSIFDSLFGIEKLISKINFPPIFSHYNIVGQKV